MRADEKPARGARGSRLLCQAAGSPPARRGRRWTDGQVYSGVTRTTRVAGSRARSHEQHVMCVDPFELLQITHTLTKVPPGAEPAHAHVQLRLSVPREKPKTHETRAPSLYHSRRRHTSQQQRETRLVRLPRVHLQPAWGSQRRPRPCAAPPQDLCFARVAGATSGPTISGELRRFHHRPHPQEA